MEIIDNINRLLDDDLKQVIQPESKLKIAASCLSIYAYEALRAELEKIESLQFIFTSPAFVPGEVNDKLKKEHREFHIPKLKRERSLYGSEFEMRLRNELTQKAIAKDCAEWMRHKAIFRSNRGQAPMQQFAAVTAEGKESVYLPLHGFTAVDLGYEKGNAVSNFFNRIDEQPLTTTYLSLFDQIWNDPVKLEDITAKLHEHIASVYQENSPQRIYFLMLYNIFSEFLEDISADVLPNDRTGYQDSLVWKKLFNFQRDAATGIINKLETYNGCILADRVGLGRRRGVKFGAKPKLSASQFDYAPPTPKPRQTIRRSCRPAECQPLYPVAGIAELKPLCGFQYILKCDSLRLDITGLRAAGCAGSQPPSESGYKPGIKATEETLMNAPGTGATPENPTPEKLIQMASGFAPLILGAAVQHRVFDLLDQGPKTLEQVASESGASLRGIRAVMNALIGLKLLRKDDAGRYALTPESAAFLVTGKPQFLGSMFGDVQVQWRAAAAETGRWRMWLDINDVVRAGKPAAPVNLEQHGGEYFKGFVEALFATNFRAARTLAGALGIGHKEKPVRVLDLAAGSGVWGIALARESPRVTVTAVDWPSVLEITKTVARRCGLLHRFQFVAGDLLSADFGGGHNIAILGHILHTEGATRSQSLLKRTFAALAPGGIIAIADFLVNEDRTGPSMGLIWAVNMLVQTEEGDTFSFGEIGGWLRDAGFENPRPLENPGPSPLILANKPE